jgi:hypothetical protein
VLEDAVASQDTVTQMIAAVRREVPGAVGIEPRSNRNLRTFWAQTAAQPTVSRCEPDMALLATTFLLTLESAAKTAVSSWMRMSALGSATFLEVPPV